MKVLAIKLPKKGWAYELMKNLDPHVVISVHGDGSLHLWVGEKEYILKPNDNMRIRSVPEWRSFSEC